MGRPPGHNHVSTGRLALIGRASVVLSVIASVVPTLVLGGCSNDDRATIDVFAASSLADIMELVEEDYERDRPEVDLRMNLAGTNALVRQINSGADASVLVAADASFLDDLLNPPVSSPVPLATNVLTLAVPGDNPAGVDGPADLADPDVLTARCATGVPCGDLTDEFLAANGLTVGRATEEANVRSVLAKVSTGEVDAGFVYRTDVAAAEAVTEIALDEAPQATVTLAQLQQGDAADDLVRHLRSDEVAELFTRLGFGPPGDGLPDAAPGDGG